MTAKEIAGKREVSRYFLPKEQFGTYGDDQGTKLWVRDDVLYQVKTALRLMSVPPYLARNEREIMLPREVVEKDK